MAFFFSFLTACTLNLMLNHLRPGWALSRSELMVGLGSGFVGIALAYDGLTGHFFGVLAAPYYFASVENGWGLLHDSIPLRLALSNATGEMTRFFEGGGGAPPWRVWAVPVFWWMCFFGAMGFAVFCLVVILRKRWVDHERLAYPLVEVAQSLAETERGGVQLYEKGKPFFIGLLAAQAVSTGLVFIIDWFYFPMQGHNVHNF